MQQTKLFRIRNKGNGRIQGTKKDNLNAMHPHKGLEIIWAKGYIINMGTETDWS